MKMNMDVIETKEDLKDYLSRILEKYLGEIETPQLIAKLRHEVTSILNQAYQEGILEERCELIEKHPGIWEIKNEDQQNSYKPS